MYTSLICNDLDEVLATSADVLGVPCRFVADRGIKNKALAKNMSQRLIAE
jgi:hypothetical protein